MQTEKTTAAPPKPGLTARRPRLSPDLDEALRMLKSFELRIEAEPVKR